MKCQVCNAEAPSSATFCQQCGAKLAAASESAPVGGKTASVSAAQTATNDAPIAGSNRRKGPVDVVEETLWEGSYSPKAMVGGFVLATLLSIALLICAFVIADGIFRWVLLGSIGLVWLILVVRLAAKRIGISYKLTNQMFYHRRGILTRTTDRIELIEVHDVTWQQGLIQRMVNVGSIKIASSDRTDPIFHVTGVEDAEGVSSLIDKARRAEQVRRGRRIDFSSIDHET
jgi:membrane protein YdbS with pleckstrin-like domain